MWDNISADAAIYLDDPARWHVEILPQAVAAGISKTDYTRATSQVARQIKEDRKKAENEKKEDELEARIAQARADAAAGQRFIRGDHAEIAQHLASKLVTRSDADVVYDLGYVHEYNGKSGIFRAVKDDELSCIVQGWAGRPVGPVDSDKVYAIKINDSTVKGAASLACDIFSYRTPDKFFASAPRGVAFVNGFVFVDGDELVMRPHGPENRARFTLPFAYNESAPRARWDAFLREIFSPDEDREDKIIMLQQFVGACLFGMATRYQRAMMLTGSGDNGKSVFLKVISSLFPDEARKAIAPQDFGDDNKGAELANARLNVAGEIPDRKILSGDMFKAIIVGDEITRRAAYERAITFKPEAGHIFSANTLPTATDTSHGFWRRWLVCTYNRQFEKHEQDPSLESYLVGEELQGVASWAVDGAAMLLRHRGYVIPSSSADAHREWQKSSNPIEQFIDECIAPVSDVEHWERAFEVYATYREWASQRGYHAMNETNFGLKLRELKIEKKRKNNGMHYRLKLGPRSAWEVDEPLRGFRH